MTSRFALLAAAVATGILRVIPNRVAEATEEVRITFDRPVAVELNQTIDPSTFFSIAPSVDGLLQWLDPVTLRFKPNHPLQPSQTYTVTIANNFMG
jgi:hypothetical protein